MGNKIADVLADVYRKGLEKRAAPSVLEQQSRLENLLADEKALREKAYTAAQAAQDAAAKHTPSIAGASAAGLSKGVGNVISAPGLLGIGAGGLAGAAMPINYHLPYAEFSKAVRPILAARGQTIADIGAKKAPFMESLAKTRSGLRKRMDTLLTQKGNYSRLMNQFSPQSPEWRGYRRRMFAADRGLKNLQNRLLNTTSGYKKVLGPERLKMILDNLGGKDKRGKELLAMMASRSGQKYENIIKDISRLAKDEDLYKSMYGRTRMDKFLESGGGVFKRLKDKSLPWHKRILGGNILRKGVKAPVLSSRTMVESLLEELGEQGAKDKGTTSLLRKAFTPKRLLRMKGGLRGAGLVAALLGGAGLLTGAGRNIFGSGNEAAASRAQAEAFKGQADKLKERGQQLFEALKGHL